MQDDSKSFDLIFFQLLNKMIIFVCNTLQTEIDRIKNLCSTNGYSHITYKQTEKQNGTYGLTLKIV